MNSHVPLCHTNDLRSSPYRLVISNNNLAERLIALLAKSPVARLPNPIASPDNHPRRNLGLTNATVAIGPGGPVTYFLRGIGTEGREIVKTDHIGEWRLKRNEGISRIFRAWPREDDPFTLETISSDAVLATHDDATIDREDPRATYVPDLGRYVIFINETRPSRKPNKVPILEFSPAVFTTTDFEKYKRLRGNPQTGLLLYTKDWVAFPKKVLDPYGKKVYAALFSNRVPTEFKDHSVMKDYFKVKPGLWIAYSKDFIYWYGHREITLPDINEAKEGPGSPPIDKGTYWLEFPHPVKIEQPHNGGIRYLTQVQYDALTEEEKQKTTRVYTPKAIKLDKEQPHKALAITGDLAQPEGDWEINPDYRLRHHMITAAMECVLLDGHPVEAYIIWYGGADRNTLAELINPEFLHDQFHSFPKERVPEYRPIPKP